MSKAYKYRSGNGLYDKDGKSLFERDVITIANNQIYLPTKQNLNDPTEGIYSDYALREFFNAFKKYSKNVHDQYNSFIEKLENVGVYSLSKTYNNELLWAYYASAHTGFAIEYDLDKLEQSLNYNQYIKQFFKFDVEYLEDIPQIDISILKKDVNEILKRCIGTKSTSWSHENELRLIFENTGLFEIDYRAVTGIYFGCRTPESDIDYIMDKLKGRGLKYYQMINVENSYMFEAKPIRDRCSDAPQYIANNVSYDIDDLLLCGGLEDEEIHTYKKYFEKILEIIKVDPQIKEFYLATIRYDQQKPILKVCGYTKSKFPPVKSFEFKINKHDSVVQIN